ncbi:MAG: PIG-L family deacetylase [Gemmatimonadota bacterium]|nr:PIG-L family deacetylase [Gemmatimonadota bacterium]MDE2983733.1 PIG-L family deacetylase [Gemmatimonadota bacterium]
MSRTTLAVAASLTLFPAQAAAQPPPPLDRVLAFPISIPGEQLHPNRGAAGAWHSIRKLATTASILHITAHPDDEHAGMLTLASRGWGARTALLSLNRGEGGANAIGPELFDALGLIRTRELVLSGRYYGLDDLYFTTAVDYGYSKSVEEAFRNWDREAVLEDMVRVIRLNRPLVVVSRFHGTRRDGHGHHHVAGLLTPEAVEAAADPERFPGQIEREGLRPWRVLRVFRGGLRVDEPHDVVVDADVYSALLGTSYQRWASVGLSRQRSQTSGRVRGGGGRVYRYERLGNGDSIRDGTRNAGFVGRFGAEVADNVHAEDFFAGMDTSLPGLLALSRETPGTAITQAMSEIQALVEGIMGDFDFTAPEKSVPELVRGYRLLNDVIDFAAPETAFHLRVKQRQFGDAIVAAAGVEAVAELEGGAGGAVLVPGEEAAVAVRVESNVGDRARISDVQVLLGKDEVLTTLHIDYERVVPEAEARAAETAGAGQVTRLAEVVDEVFEMRIPSAAAPAGPYFTRSGLAANRYEVADSTDLHLPWRQPQLRAVVRVEVLEERVPVTVPVTGSVSRLPYGSLARRVEVLPALSVTMSPRVRVVARGSGREGEGGGRGGEAGPPGEIGRRGRGGGAGEIEVLVQLEANHPDLSAEAELELPAGWTATPASYRHDFRGRGEVAEALFSLQPPAEWSGDAVVEAVARATVNGVPGEYRSGFQTIDHRDLPLARLALRARTTIRPVDVAPLDGLSVGYAMGVGDEVPAAIEALGASVRMLGEAELTHGALGSLDAIVIGTRAYAVRRDLVENNHRLIDYARGGGNLVVLYQTQEFVPGEMAPWPASLPRGAEEVSEEDAPVTLLEPAHPLLATPNRITEADFDGWLEQRGSKFFAQWDDAYTPLVETHDTGQEPQRGVWLTAEVGAGRYSYVALALHRQLPYGVPGAYRILSNLLWRRPPSR